MPKLPSVLIAASAVLASCTIGTERPGGAYPGAVPSAGAAETAAALARLAEIVCLPAQAEGLGTAAFVGREGAAGLGLRPALPPKTGWVTVTGPEVALAERQGACFASVAQPQPGMAGALVDALAAPPGSRVSAKPSAAGAAFVRAVCRSGTTLTVIEAPASDGQPTLGVAVPPVPVPCAAPLPEPPSRKPSPYAHAEDANGLKHNRR